VQNSLRPPKSCTLLYWQRYCTALEQWARAKLCRVEHTAPPIFSKATITLGIGPHSSYCCCNSNGNVGDCDFVDLFVEMKQALHRLETAIDDNEGQLHTECHVELSVVSVPGLIDLYEQSNDLDSWQAASCCFGKIKLLACSAAKNSAHFLYKIKG